LQLKSEQYRAAGTFDVFGTTWTGALLREILDVQGSNFAGLCSVLKVHGRIVAGHVGMRSRTVLHYWFPVYDPAYAKFSAGIILLLRIANAVADQGVTLIDLGKGESAYKARLSTGAAEVAEGFVERPSSKWVLINRLRRRTEAWARSADSGTVLRLPARIVLRMEQASKFR
jgi:CelD/BcsL family acetyltransferase involved in cellulose biosynthesis